MNNEIHQKYQDLADKKAKLKRQLIRNEEDLEDIGIKIERTKAVLESSVNIETCLLDDKFLLLGRLINVCEEIYKLEGVENEGRD